MFASGGTGMIAKTHAFALIGRNHPSADYEALYQASLAARAERRAANRRDGAQRAERRWRGSGEPVDLPLRLPE